MSNAAPESSRRRWTPHTGSIVVALVTLLAALGVALGLSVSSSAATNRALSSQLRSVETALQASNQTIYRELVAADGLAATSPTVFRGFAADEVGTEASAPLRSISLWSVPRRGTPRELATVGPSPELLGLRGLGTEAIARVRAGNELDVLGLFQHPKVLGVAVRLPGASSDLVVFAEDWVPSPAGTPALSGLDFALFYGLGTSRDALMSATISVPPSGSTRRDVVAFGSATITVLVGTGGRPAGTVDSNIIWAIVVAGVLVALGASAGVERLVRRREAAESVATQRSLDYVAQREIAQTLQDALRPATPTEVEGLEFATRYVAGVANLDVGGDWFDAIPVDPTRLFVTVGDVSGRGLAAATVMGSLRHAIRAYALQGDDPDEVLRKLSGIVDVTRDGCFATVLCAVFDVGRRRVTVANAGHPPPLLVDSRGARFVSSHVGAPVGVHSRNVATPTTLRAVPGATIFLYTDGLIERRGRSLDDGLDLLSETARRATGTLDELIESILAELAPGGGEDDLAVFGLRWR